MQHAIGIRTSQNTKGEPITLETIQAAPTAHTRGMIHRRLQPLYTQTKKRFPAPAPSTKIAPCTSHAATTMRFAATRTHPCSHYNAICIHTSQNTKGEQFRPRNDRSRNRRTQEVPFIATCSHFTRKNMVSRSGFPTQAPCNIHAAITMRFAASRGKPACICAHENKTKRNNNHAASCSIMLPLHCNLQTWSQQAHGTTHR